MRQELAHTSGRLLALLSLSALVGVGCTGGGGGGDNGPAAPLSLFDGVPAFPAGGLPKGLAAADLDNDGRIDAVVAISSDDAIAVFRGANDDVFGRPTRFAAGDQPEAVAIADVNRDTFLDVVTANGDAGTVSVLLNDGHAGFAG